MAIESKELMLSPRFEGYGSFGGARPGNGEWHPTYLFNWIGGQASVEVSEDEVLNAPPEGTVFFLAGHIRYNPRNGTVGLVTVEKKLVTDVTPEQMFAGVRIRGVGMVQSKSSTSMNRQTFLKATLQWLGAVHEFRRISPELFQRIPSKGCVRFELGLQVQSERSQTGQTVQLQFPMLLAVQAEELKPSAGVVAPSPSAGATIKPLATSKV